MFAAMYVGATLVVARKDGDEILRCAQNDRDGGYALRGTGGAEPRPYGVYMSAEENSLAIRESPLRCPIQAGGGTQGGNTLLPP